METLFFILADDAPKWSLDINYVWGLLGILILVVSAALVLLSRTREEVRVTEAKRADANEKLVKTRDVELADCEEAVEEKEKTIARLSQELTTVLGIKIIDLAKFWAQKEEMEAKCDNIEEENRRLKRRLEER